MQRAVWSLLNIRGVGVGRWKFSNSRQSEGPAFFCQQLLLSQLDIATKRPNMTPCVEERVARGRRVT